jgi:hypothetical protein
LSDETNPQTNFDPSDPTTHNPQPTTKPASPVPEAAALDIPAEISEHEIVIRFSTRRYRIRGLAKNHSYEVLKINLLAARGDAFHVDSLDLYSARQRQAFIKQAALELAVKPDLVKKDLGRVLLKLEQLQHEQIQRTLAPKDDRVSLNEAQKAAALELLRSPNLTERITGDLERCGLVGEETNKLVAYLAAVSRKLAKPLAVMVQSSSAAGKSALMDAVLAMVPEEERVQYSAMTGQSLFYMGEQDLAHKVLAIAEEEGASRASYALKLLQSEGQLTIASTGKDPTTGRLMTHEYRVEGPAAILLTTTAIDLDEELLNRCIVLAVDESREQTRAIHHQQRQSRTLAGLDASQARSEILELHQNAQRLLRPLAVVNPFADRLGFVDVTTRTRRDHLKYLGLIEVIALLHQYQRPVRRGSFGSRQLDYIEVEAGDIELAGKLASVVLGRTLDELPPQTRRLLEAVHAMVLQRCEHEGIDQAELRFTRRETLDATGMSYSQIRKHLDRLVAYEYVLIHRGCRGQSMVYELLWQGEGSGGEVFLMGLIDPTTTTSLTPSQSEFDPSLIPHCPPFDPLLTPAEFSSKSNGSSVSGELLGESSGNRIAGTSESPRRTVSDTLSDNRQPTTHNPS